MKEMIDLMAAMQDFMEAMNDRMSRIEEHIGLCSPVESQIRDILIDNPGNTIAALKKHRDLTGDHLIDSRIFVDKIRVELGIIKESDAMTGNESWRA